MRQIVIIFYLWIDKMSLNLKMSMTLYSFIDVMVQGGLKGRVKILGTLANLHG